MYFKRYMAIAEAKRKDCPRCNFGDYNRNEVICTTCKKDCPFMLFHAPTEAAIVEAAAAIDRHFKEE